MNESDLQTHLEMLTRSHDVVVFMKGDRRAPACGFSARVIDILDAYLEEYRTYDVLTDECLRDGIKVFSGWKTIPQIFVRGEFIGGSDILGEMARDGELSNLLGREQNIVDTVALDVSDVAQRALLDYWEGEGAPQIRLCCSASFDHELDFGGPQTNDAIVSFDWGKIYLDQASARRCAGVAIDFVDADGVTGFKIDNPNEPPKVHHIIPEGLLKLIDDVADTEIFDVRTPMERDIARIEPSRLLDESGKEYLESLPRDRTLVFYCGHGLRSAAAAEHALAMGFAKVYNLSGGIDAWERFAMTQSAD